MAHHVCGCERRKCNAVNAFEHLLRIDQTTLLTFGQVDLADVTRDHRLGAKAQPGQKHFHLFRCGVLCFIQDDEGVVQCATSHEGQGGNLQGLAFERFLNSLKAHQVVKRIIQRPQIGVHLLAKVAWQKAQFFTRLYGRSGEHNALHRLALKCINGHGNGQISFARARGPSGPEVTSFGQERGGLVQGIKIRG